MRKTGSNRRAGHRRGRQLWSAAALSLLLAATAPAAARAGASASVVGGTQVAEGQLPWVAALTLPALLGASDFARQFCGASLVAPKVVVTAAHCVRDRHPRDVEIVLDKRRLADPGGERRSVSAIEINPGFDHVGLSNDVAVLQLASASTVAPADLPRAGQADGLWDPGDAATVAGWGLTSENGARSSVLRSAVVSVVTDAECGARYGSNFDPSSMLCAGASEGGLDACQGDSGGPLAVTDGGSWTLIGTVSWGFGCARPDYPGVYSRLGGDVLGDWTRSRVEALQNAPDRFAPTTEIVRRGALRHSKRPWVRFRSPGESGTGFQCSIDGRRYHRCTPPKRIRFKRGRHVFRVRAVDWAGNADPTPARVVLGSRHRRKQPASRV
ncbi:MAG: serine protease [Solirubrobacterales bacterium]|nr:serine protease [Solirubrobacterales bacterium]